MIVKKPSQPPRRVMPPPTDAKVSSLLPVKKAPAK